MDDPRFYFDKLYPFQDRVLRQIHDCGTAFYLTGGTALSRGLINDVPAHVGQIRVDDVLGRLDSAENILANKVTAAIDRTEPKDLADIWALCCKMSLPLSRAIEDAGSKAAGVFPADLARVLCTATKDHWQIVRWIDAPDVDQFLAELRNLGESLIL